MIVAMQVRARYAYDQTKPPFEIAFVNSCQELKRTCMASADLSVEAMMPDASIKAVFSTPELLEGILLNFRWSDLLTAPRVCRQFHDITNESPQLHWKLRASRASWRNSIKYVGMRQGPSKQKHSEQ